MTAFRLPRPVPALLSALVLTAAVSLTLAGSASAQEFEVAATGVINSVDNSGGYYDSSVAVGTPFTYSYLADFSLPPTFDNFSVYYMMSGAPYGGTSTYGDYHVAANSSTSGLIGVFTVDDNRPDGLTDLEFSSATRNTADFGGPVTVMSDLSLNNEIGFLDYNETYLPAVSQYSLLLLTDASFTNSVSNGVTGQTSSFTATVTSLSAALVPVPEASTVVSLGIISGLGGLVLAVGQKRKSRKTRG